MSRSKSPHAGPRGGPPTRRQKDKVEEEEEGWDVRWFKGFREGESD